MTPREVPTALRCKCGELIRWVYHGGIPIKADDEPVAGGELLVNVDEVVLRLAPAAAGVAKRAGDLGFRTHQCPRSRR